jgi:hypothetical protein
MMRGQSSTGVTLTDYKRKLTSHVVQSCSVEKLIKLRGKSNKQSPELKEFRHKNFEDIRSHHNIHHTVRNLKDAVKNGRAGEGPLKMGPIQGVLPDCMFTYMRTAIQKGQIVGLELNSKRRGLLLRSFYENTEYEKVRIRPQCKAREICKQSHKKRWFGVGMDDWITSTASKSP